MSSAWTYKIDVGENNLDGKSMHRFFEFSELEKTFASFSVYNIFEHLLWYKTYDILSIGAIIKRLYGHQTP